MIGGIVASFALCVVLPARALVHSVHHANTGKHRSNLCSLKQDTWEELTSLLKHRPGRHESCFSFVQTQARASFGRPARGVDYLSFVQADGHFMEGGSPRQAVWVNGYPRSGSSTILSMVAAAGGLRPDSRQMGHTFSLFEPCHDGDTYTPWLEAQGCGRLLAGLAQCDFKGIESLWGWRDPHTTSNHSKYSQKVAKDLCQQSRITAFKTVDYGHNISEWRWFMDQAANLRIIDVVRDPRGIYASWKTIEPFSDIVGTPDFYSITDVCDTFQANLDLQDDRVFHIVFEELTKDPLSTVRKVYDFLKLPVSSAQEEWVKNTFNAQGCPEPKPWQVGFTDCHTNSVDAVDKWRTVLTDEEKKAFDTSKSCQRVAAAYNFPKD